MSLGAGSLDARTHRILVVFNYIHDRKLPKLRHVEGLVHLPLIGGTVTEIGERHRAVLFVFVRERQSGADGNLRAYDPMAAVEFLLFAEHMHGATLASG